VKPHSLQEVLMNADHHTSTWLLESQLEPYVDAYMLHLFDCRYASNTIDNYLAGLTHFAHRISQCNIDVKSIDDIKILIFCFNKFLLSIGYL
jgi:predicted HD phosphohydrolase